MTTEEKQKALEMVKERMKPGWEIPSKEEIKKMQEEYKKMKELERKKI